MKVSTIVFPVQGEEVFLSLKKEGFGAGFLNGYGGKQKLTDPTIAHTAARELEEEAGIIVSPEKLAQVAVINFFEVDMPIFECHIFFCREWEGNFRESEEMGLAEPYLISNIPYDRMWDADRVWLPLVFSRKKIKAISKYCEGMNKQESFKYEEVEFP